MKIAVLQKVVVDTYAVPNVSDDGTSIEFASNVEWVNDRHSEFAIEEAVRIKEKIGGEIKTFSIREGSQTKPILKALAIGIDEALVIENKELYDSDPLTIAKALAAELKEYEPDIVVVGNSSSDINNHITGPMVAALLDYPLIAQVRKLDVEEDGVTAMRNVSGRDETYTCSYPLVITTHKALNEPRYPKLPDIMKAKQKPLEEKETPENEFTNAITHVRAEKPSQDKEVRMLEGELEDIAEQLATILIDEEKVI